MSGMLLTEPVSCQNFHKFVRFAEPVREKTERRLMSIANADELHDESMQVISLKSVKENKHSVAEKNYSFIKETVVKAIHSPQITDVKQSLKTKTGKLSVRRKTGPHIPHVLAFKTTRSNCSTKYNGRPIQRSISDPGKGNLPNLDILGHLFEATISSNTVPSTSNCSETSTSYTENRECGENIPVDILPMNKSDEIQESFDQYLQGKVADAIKCSTFGRQETNDSFDEIETESSIVKDTENGDIERSTSDVVNLESEINYTHGDVNFLKSINDDDLFSDSKEILYARPYDKDEISDCEDQKKGGETCEVDHDSALIEYIDGLNKETDFRTTSDELQCSSSSVKASSSNSYDEGKVIDLNFEDSLDNYPEANLETFESDLNDAIQESVNSNTMTPIIKKELQFKIQCQRLKRGEEELQTEFSEPKTYQLTDEEIQKRNARREQNRRSAKKGRVRAKQRERDLAKILNKASASIAEMSRQLVDLRAEKTKLIQELVEHWGGCLKSTLVENQKKIIASIAL